MYNVRYNCLENLKTIGMFQCVTVYEKFKLLNI